MIYLANALINNKISLELYNSLLEKGFEVYIPNLNIKYEGREININAFEQLRKRNPTNPYITELKREILKELNENIIESPNMIVCNSMNEVFTDQTIWEISIAWYLHHNIYSYNDIHSINRELCSAIGIISLKGDSSNLSLTKYFKPREEPFDPFSEMTTLHEPKQKKGKQKLTIKE